MARSKLEGFLLSEVDRLKKRLDEHDKVLKALLAASNPDAPAGLQPETQAAGLPSEEALKSVCEEGGDVGAKAPHESPRPLRILSGVVDRIKSTYEESRRERDFRGRL